MEESYYAHGRQPNRSMENQRVLVKTGGEDR